MNILFLAALLVLTLLGLLGGSIQLLRSIKERPWAMWVWTPTFLLALSFTLAIARIAVMCLAEIVGGSAWAGLAALLFLPAAGVCTLLAIAGLICICKYFTLVPVHDGQKWSAILAPPVVFVLVIPLLVYACILRPTRCEVDFVVQDENGRPLAAVPIRYHTKCDDMLQSFLVHFGDSGTAITGPDGKASLHIGKFTELQASIGSASLEEISYRPKYQDLRYSWRMNPTLRQYFEDAGFWTNLRWSPVTTIAVSYPSAGWITCPPIYANYVDQQIQNARRTSTFPTRLAAVVNCLAGEQRAADLLSLTRFAATPDERNAAKNIIDGLYRRNYHLKSRYAGAHPGDTNVELLAQIFADPNAARKSSKAQLQLLLDALRRRDYEFSKALGKKDLDERDAQLKAYGFPDPPS
ncbi:MAG: hypothetical protein ACTHN5_15210 [Phycisphaerae bacterium]